MAGGTLCAGRPVGSTAFVPIGAPTAETAGLACADGANAMAVPNIATAAAERAILFRALVAVMMVHDFLSKQLLFSGHELTQGPVEISEVAGTHGLDSGCVISVERGNHARAAGRDGIGGRVEPEPDVEGVNRGERRV